jgi:hypothetical protein
MISPLGNCLGEEVGSCLRTIGNSHSEIEQITETFLTFCATIQSTYFLSALPGTSRNGRYITSGEIQADAVGT